MANITVDSHWFLGKLSIIKNCLSILSENPDELPRSKLRGILTESSFSCLLRPRLSRGFRKCVNKKELLDEALKANQNLIDAVKKEASGGKNSYC